LAINRNQRKDNFKKSLENYFENNFLDIQGLSSTTIDEAYLARILTKLAVSSATVWWSLMEVKQFIDLRKTAKGPLK